jgi:alpha-tubulin suppressor-like RCC1 family protein
MKRSLEASPLSIPDFLRNKKAIREQIYEANVQALKDCVSQIDINSSDYADRVALLFADFNARNREYMNCLYPPPDFGGDVVALGSDDARALGLASDSEEDVNEEGVYPRLIPKFNLPDQGKILQIACGGMHSVVLTKNGEVWTMGNNDDYALGT